MTLEDHPAGRSTVATHFRCPMPTSTDVGRHTAEPVRAFPDLPRVEGIALDHEGRFFYVTDEDEGVEVRFTDPPARR